jgi:hypothetical protein
MRDNRMKEVQGLWRYGICGCTSFGSGNKHFIREEFVDAGPDDGKRRRTMARIKIEDLPRDMNLPEKDMRTIFGGPTRRVDIDHIGFLNPLADSKDADGWITFIPEK